MLDQITFDQSEEIADALSAQAGLDAALMSALEPVLGRISPDQETTIMALIEAQAHFRGIALAGADQISRSGAEV